MTFHPQDLIRRKRDGERLSAEEMQAFVHAVTHGGISDAQTAAWLMAVFLKGLDAGELAGLTQAMRFSGEVFNAGPLGSFTVDKHSTGGVGDKTSLLIAPVLAAAGLRVPTSRGVPGLCVPMISGRSLGHTGGTLDKLESIPGFSTQLPLTRLEQILRRCGACLIGQTPALVPADRILYGLRDHTSTVESPYLITASIMSKKLAESLDALVLDVKTGCGAFMQRREDAELLARLMVETGNAAGTRTVAVLTSHAQPIGRYAGNWLEVKECVDILQQRRHAMSADLIELSNVLSGHALSLAGFAESPGAGALLADEMLRDGSAYGAWVGIVEAQGGDLRVFDDADAFHQLRASRTLSAHSAGFVSAIDTKAVGWAVQRLGAGRAAPGEPVDAHAGIEVHAKLGERVASGQPLVTLHAASESLLSEPFEMLREAYVLAATPPLIEPQVLEVIR